MSGSSRRRALLSTAALAAVLVQPIGAPPSYAVHCDLRLPGDCTPPDTTITQKPDAETESRDATFTFSADEAGATFECRFDAGTSTGNWGPCEATQSGDDGSTGSQTYSGLIPGTYTFSVQATDAPAVGHEAGNTDPSPATYTWEVVEPSEPPPPPPPDTEDPDTYITNGADRWHPFSYLGVQYASDKDASRWECTLNGTEQTCNDDQKNILGMKAGDYLFTVAAVVDGDPDRVDPTPAKERWTVPMDNTLFKKHSSEWEKVSGEAARGYFQDSYSIASERGAFIEQAKKGFKSLVLVATRCQGCGKVEVYLKDTLLKTVNLSADSTEKRQIIPVASWRAKHSGRVRLVVASQGKDVIIDGLGFSARR